MTPWEPEITSENIRQTFSLIEPLPLNDTWVIRPVMVTPPMIRKAMELGCLPRCVLEKK